MTLLRRCSVYVSTLYTAALCIRLHCVYDCTVYTAALCIRLHYAYYAYGCGEGASHPVKRRFAVSVGSALSSAACCGRRAGRRRPLRAH